MRKSINMRNAAIDKMVIAGMFNQDAEKTLNRLALLHINLDALVNGVIVAVKVKDMELLKQTLLKTHGYGILEVTDILRVCITQDNCVEVHYEYNYARCEEGEVKSSTTIHTFGLDSDDSITDMFELEMV